MSIYIPMAIKAKLMDKHGGITEDDVVGCFYNRTHGFLIDSREEHKTDPPTMWFISETDRGRLLKVCCIDRGTYYEIKTAYDADNPDVVEMYYRIATQDK